MSKFSPRRRLMLGASATVIGLGAASGAVWWARRSVSPFEQTVTSVVDTLVPADAFAGAVDIGLDQRLLTQAKQHLATRAMCERLMQAIERYATMQHQQHFVELTQDQREALLEGLLINSQQRQTRSDMKKFRTTVFSWYYQTKTGHDSLGYQLPARYPAYNG